MTETERAKAALAALADVEREAGGVPENGESGSETTGGQGGPEHASGSAASVFEWGADGTDEQPTSGQGEPAAEYRTVIERAVAATEDLEAAADFVESVGLDGLERAVERAEREVSGLATEGREALATFERYRAAAEGAVEE